MDYSQLRSKVHLKDINNYSISNDSQTFMDDLSINSTKIINRQNTFDPNNFSTDSFTDNEDEGGGGGGMSDTDNNLDIDIDTNTLTPTPTPTHTHTPTPLKISFLVKIIMVLKKFVKYIGPGLMVSVSYMDPGNFSSSIASAQFQYKLLFSLTISNIMAGFLQVLASKLGICTGQDLAFNCRLHLNSKLNILIYIFAEISVAATDIAEIIGTAIAFNILFGIPLLIGVLLTIIDVLFVIMAYRPNGPLIILRVFEGIVSLLVFGTVICFTIELINVSPSTNWNSVFRGFLPSEEIFKDIKGLYLSAALLGSNLMPHSLYLGSGVVQSRLKAFDIKHGFYKVPIVKKKRSNKWCVIMDDDNNDDEDQQQQQQQINYKPSINAINSTMSYTIAELVVSLLTVALFVNAAILIVAGTALSEPMDDDGDGDLENPDLFTLHYLLSSHLSKTAGTVFALALLCSGLCGGTVVTIASQQIMEGHARFTMPAGLRRIITRIIAIIPCLIVVLISGREGLSDILNASQVALSLFLPFISAPLIYFTCNKEIMKVQVSGKVNGQESIVLNDYQERLLNEDDDTIDEIIDDDDTPRFKDMSNGTLTSTLAIIIWCIITFLNFWLLASIALGKDVPL